MHSNVIIIGGGITGIHILYELRLQNIDVFLLEKEATVGGLWKHKMKDWQILQNTKKDFCMYGLSKSKYKKYMDKANVVDYINTVASFVSDNIINNAKVLHIKKNNNKWWINTTQTKYSCNHLIISTGLFESPKELPFKKSNLVYHSSEIQSINVKSCAIVGGGASALDMIYQAKNCEKIFWLVKNQRWFIPMFFSVGKFLNQPLSLFGFFQMILPKKILYNLLNQIIKMPYLFLGLKKYKPNRKLDLTKKEPVILHKKNANCLKQKNIIRIKSSINQIKKNKIILENGQEILVDKIIYCTGYKIQNKIFSLTIGPLFCHFIPINHRNLYYIGSNISFSGTITHLSHTLGKTIGHFITGKAKLPNNKIMKQQIKNQPRVINHLEWKKLLSKYDPYEYKSFWYFKEIGITFLGSLGFYLKKK